MKRKTQTAMLALAALLLAVAAGWACDQGDDDDDDDAADDDNAAEDDDGSGSSDDDADDDLDDDVATDDDLPSLLDTDHSDCKDGSTPEAKDDEYPIDIEFAYEDGVLTVTHVNGVFNCCLERIDVTLNIDGWAITLYEVEYTPEPCWCECPFDVVSQIGGLAPGTYTVDIYANGDYSVGGEVVIPEEG